MRPTRWWVLLSLSIPVMAACAGEKPAPRNPRPSLLLVTPKPPGSMIVDTSGTEEAERLTAVAPMSAEDVARFYRVILRQSGWQLRNDRSAGDLIDLYADGGPLGGSTMWIHIERQDTLSARFTLIANTPQSTLDSIARRTAPARSSATIPDSASH